MKMKMLAWRKQRRKSGRRHQKLGVSAEIGGGKEGIRRKAYRRRGGVKRDCYSSVKSDSSVAPGGEKAASASKMKTIGSISGEIIMAAAVVAVFCRHQEK